jgi:hypothetical protein
VTRLRALTGPWWPYLVLTAVPLAVFVLPDLITGRLVISGDNLQQNYPLRVLVGSMFRHGELPFWNSYIFSGTPLMAGFNAGAFYPLIAFFIALPDRAAWLATEVFVFSAVAVGMYVFLRALKLRTVACFLGAATYAFAGPVLSQANHLDMTEGFAAIPWMLLAVHHITRHGRWRWSVLLGIAYATVVLAGAPEAMLDEALLVLCYAALSAGLDRRRWWLVLSRGATGAVLALSLSAIQWLPGLEAIRNSQRGAGVFAAAGSYPTPFSILALVPYLDGGYGHLGEATFFSQYNLPEVGIYLGILPLIALVTLVHPRWPSRIAARDRLTWYGVAAFGYLLALGSNTPLEHLFNRLPLYGHQRLQSRNMITVATAVCVLFAGWLDRTEPARQEGPLRRYDRVMSLVPLAAVVALGFWALVAPGSLVHVFAGVAATPAVTSTVRRASLWALVLCAGGSALVWIRPWLSTNRWKVLVVGFVAFDLGVMVITSQLAASPPNDVLAGTSPVQQLMAAHLVPGGRMVNYDPQTYDSYPGSPQGIPDLNIVPRLPSVSGYASIVNNTYESVTHTHEQADLDIGQLTSGMLAKLDLRELVTLPEYFLVPLASMPAGVGQDVERSEAYGADPVLPRGYGAEFNDTAYPFLPEARPALEAGQSASWYFGESLVPTAATLVLARPAAAGTDLRAGLLEPDGSTRWGRSVTVPAGSTHAAVPVVRGPGIGLTVSSSGPLPAQRAVVSVDGSLYELGGSLSSAIVPGIWDIAGFAQGFAVFTLPRPAQPVTARTVGGLPLAVHVLSSTTKSEEVQVRAPTAATVTRSVAWDSGWTATVSVGSRPARRAPVDSVDLVQQVRIPAGDVRITFRYRPPHLLVASTLSLGAAAVLLVAGAVVLVRRRRTTSAEPALSSEDGPG